MPDDNIRAVWSEDELDRALAALHLAAEPDEQAFGRARTELLASAGAGVGLGAVAAGPVAAGPPRRSRWVRWAAVAATAAAVAAGVLVVQTVRPDDTDPTAAGEKLSFAADQTGAADGPLAPGQYRYIATHAWWMSSSSKYAYLGENLLETWVPADQTEEWLWRRDVTGARKWVVSTEAEARANDFPLDETDWPEGEWRAPCGDWYAEEEGREPCTARATWQSPTAEFLSSLPRDPDQLYNRLRNATRNRGKDPDLEVLVYAADLLRTGLIPPDLRAALYRALAKLPSLEITEQVANLDGHKGTAYGISAAGTRLDVIIDPTTGQFIGEREVTEKAFENIPAGTVMQSTSVTTAVVSRMGVRP